MARAPLAVASRGVAADSESLAGRAGAQPSSSACSVGRCLAAVLPASTPAVSARLSARAGDGVPPPLLVGAICSRLRLAIFTMALASSACDQQYKRESVSIALWSLRGNDIF